MNQRKEWIKKGLEICAHDFNYTEEEKIKSFTELERQYGQFTKTERREITETIRVSLEIKDRIYVYSYFLHYMKTEELEQAAFEAVLQMDFDFYTGSMLELQLIGAKGLYRQQRKLHRKNVESFGKALHLDLPYLPVRDRNRKRIAIMTGQILSLLHAPTKVVLDTAYVLQEQLGYEVKIFICPCNGVMPEGMWYSQDYMRSDEDFRNDALGIKYGNAVFKEFQVDLEPLNLKEYQMMFELIHAWNPMFVLGIGAINPVIDLCEKFTTLVMRAGSSGCPVSEAGILVRLVRQTEELEEEYEKALSDGQVQMFMEEKPPVVIEKSQNHYCRSKLGLPEDKFLIAVVGNRLDSEIDLEFVAVMQRILEKSSAAAFAIIGEVEKVKNYFTELIFSGRVFYLGFCNDLVGTYGIMNLYMNPRRMGGGYSAMMALAAGIPVISLPECDVAEHVGKELLAKNYQEMEEMTLRYIADPQFYESKRQYAQKRSEENTEEKQSEYVRKMIERVTELAEERG